MSEQMQVTGAYCVREAFLQKEEESGNLRFECCSFDGIEQHMIWLIGLKNIFAKQLPNMPKSYIVRLLMDGVHKSMMAIKDNTVVGGITYCPYSKQKFGEIAFCAIVGNQQVKGFGTRLMNQLKHHAREKDNITHFLTYADNNAVGYFSKQGFTREITFPEQQWKGYIKDYDGGTLMECHLAEGFPFIDLPKVIQSQRMAINEKIQELSNCHLVYPGIDFQKNEWGISRKKLKVENIPGVKEIMDKNLISAASPFLTPFLKYILKLLVEHADSWPFREPVNAKEVTDYYDIIKHPVDLKTISKRVESEEYYVTLSMFVSDIKRMCTNARTYNAPDTIYYKCANKLETFAMNKIKSSISGGTFKYS